MQQAILHLLCIALVGGGVLLIWNGHPWMGSAAMLCGGAAAGLRQTREGATLSGAFAILGGFMLLLGGGYLLYLRYTLCGIAVSLLAMWSWCFTKRANDSAGTHGFSWRRVWAFACFAFWIFGAAFLFRGETVMGGLLLAGSVVSWYAMERMMGRRVVLSLTLLGEVCAWCGAVVAISHQNFGTAAIFIALFLVSRLVDDYLLVRKGYELCEGEGPLSFRAYLNLHRDDAHRYRAMGLGE